MRRYWLAIPTYWTHPGGQGREEVIFDHPTPLDTPGTLRRTLESLVPLVSEGVRVGVVAAAASPDLEREVERRVRKIIHSPPLPYKVAFFSASHLKILREFTQKHGASEWLPLLSLSGYSQIRNLTLVLANICEAEVLVSLDDDEVIADPDFLAKIDEDFDILGRDHAIFGLAGIYRQANGSVHLPEPREPWACYWPKMRWLNDALTELALTQPRLKPTYLGFGGNLALSSTLFRRLPFDAALTRGEDVDYVINARMFQIPFFLDNTLAIVHLPPDKPHPTWLRLRQDLLRFCYTRRKLQQQEPQPDLATVTPAQFKPYPGLFLEDDLPLRAFHSHTLLALDYLAAGDPEGARCTLENLALMHSLDQSGKKVFQEYLRSVSQWQALQCWLADPQVAALARRAIWGAS
jgi:hypothetical protein